VPPLLFIFFPKPGERKVAAGEPDEGEGVADESWEVGGAVRSPAAGVAAGGGRAYDSRLLGVGGSMVTGLRGGPGGGGGPATEAVRWTVPAAEAKRRRCDGGWAARRRYWLAWRL
jgi:hypothetical protein